MTLTVKQETFCTTYIESGNASEAYRQAYDTENMAAATVNRKAFELTENGKIRARLKELCKEHAARHIVTIDSLVIELEDARQVAKANSTASAMVSATMGKAKLLGLDKIQIIEIDNTKLTGFELDEKLIEMLGSFERTHPFNR